MSDNKPQVNEVLNQEEVVELFTEKGLYSARMISHSKSYYMDRKEHKYNTIIFNANVFIYLNGKGLKIWFGDLNLSKEDGHILKEISEKMGTTLYVLNEMSGRFENENNAHPKEVAIWNTELEAPIVTKKYKKYMDKKVKLENKISRLESKKSKLSLDYSHSLRKIIEPEFVFGRKIIKKIAIPYEFINKEATRILEKYNKEKKIFESAIIELGEEEVYDTYDIPEYEKGLITNEAIDKFLLKELNISEGKDLNYSSLWVSYKTAKRLTKIATGYEAMKQIDGDEDEVSKKISNYAVYMAIIDKRSLESSIRIEEGKEHSIKSYDTNYIYILEGYEKTKFKH
jgi:hypothetical protein